MSIETKEYGNRTILKELDPPTRNDLGMALNLLMVRPEYCSFDECGALLGLLWPEVEVPVMVPSMGQINQWYIRS